MSKPRCIYTIYFVCQIRVVSNEKTFILLLLNVYYFSPIVQPCTICGDINGIKFEKKSQIIKNILTILNITKKKRIIVII